MSAAITPPNNDYKAPYSRDDSVTTRTETQARAFDTTTFSVASAASDSAVPTSTTTIKRANSSGGDGTNGTISNDDFWNNIADLVPTTTLVKTLKSRTIHHGRNSSFQSSSSQIVITAATAKVTANDSTKESQLNTKTDDQERQKQTVALITAQLEALKIKTPKRRYTVDGPSSQLTTRVRAATDATLSTTNTSAAAPNSLRPHLTPDSLKEALKRQQESKQLLNTTKQSASLAAQQLEITKWLQQCDLIQLYNCLFQNNSITPNKLQAAEQELLNEMREWMKTNRDPQMARLLLQVTQEIIMELRKNNLQKLCQLLHDHSESIQSENLNRLIRSAISTQKQRQLDAVTEWLKIPTDPKELITLDRIIRHKDKLNFDKLATKEFGTGGEIIIAHAFLDGEDIIKSFLKDAEYKSLIPECVYRRILLITQRKKERLDAHNARKQAAEQKDNSNTYTFQREKLTTIDSIVKELITNFPKDALNVVTKSKASAIRDMTELGSDGYNQLVKTLQTELSKRYYTMAPTKKKTQQKKASSPRNKTLTK